MFFLSEPPHTPYDLRFDIARFPVRVHPLFWVMGLVLGVMGAQGDFVRDHAMIPVVIAIWVIVVFVSILVHELGHAFAMRYYRESARIVLHMMGGLAIQDGIQSVFGQQQQARKNLDQIIISAAGPAAGFILAGLVVGIVFAAGGRIDFELRFGVIPSWYIEMIRGEGVRDSVQSNPRMIYLFLLIDACLFVNIFWGLLNLLPVYPLDGGQISRALFTARDPWKGVVSSLWLSVITGAVIAFLGLTNGRMFIGIMFAMLAYSSWQMIQQMNGRGGFGGRPW